MDRSKKLLQITEEIVYSSRILAENIEFLYDMRTAQNSYDIMCLNCVPDTNSHVTLTMLMMSSVTGAFG